MMDYVWTCTLRFWTFLDLLLSPINQIALILDWIWTSAISSPKYQIRKAVTEVTKLQNWNLPKSWSWSIIQALRSENEFSTIWDRHNTILRASCVDKNLKPCSSSKMPTKPSLSLLFVPLREQDRNLDFPFMICRENRRYGRSP